MSDSSSPDQAASFIARRASEDRAALAMALVAAGQGNRAAFEEVYKRTSAKLFGICLRIFTDRQEAEDALQDAYVTIWNRATTFEPTRASPITWLATVTRNRAIDRLRARKVTVTAPVEEAYEVPDTAPLADAALMAGQDAAALNDCMASLEARDAAFIQQAFLGGATYAELAERDAVPLGTIKSRIRRALLKLRECLSE
jgi:RNA polymerase sigma-70 factor, ECF subfamily